jgi:hypothetical protein
MAIAISPIHTDENFPNGLTLDDKIEVFIARVAGWQLGVALEMIEKDVSHRGFAVLNIIFSYFEMLAKYRHGYVGRGKSVEHFKLGVRLVFPAIEPEYEELLNRLYARVRSGLYHTGMIQPGIMLTGNVQGSIGYNYLTHAIIINPDQLAHDLRIHFEHVATALKDPTKTALRENFEKRFDYDSTDPTDGHSG